MILENTTVHVGMAFEFDVSKTDRTLEQVVKAFAARLGIVEQANEGLCLLADEVLKLAYAYNATVKGTRARKGSLKKGILKALRENPQGLNMSQLRKALSTASTKTKSIYSGAYRLVREGFIRKVNGVYRLPEEPQTQPEALR